MKRLRRVLRRVEQPKELACSCEARKESISRCTGGSRGKRRNVQLKLAFEVVARVGDVECLGVGEGKSVEKGRLGLERSEDAFKSSLKRIVKVRQ